MVTIYDIAKRTGYSAPTISKALNNQSDIGEATRLEIQAVAREMGYVPNQFAKTLITKKSWLIGVIYEEADLGVGMEHPLFLGIMNAFKQRIEAEGYELMFIARNLGRKKMSYLEHCKYRGVDGVLLLNCAEDNGDVAAVAGGVLPCVSANIVYPGIINVTSENFAPAAEAVRYLHSLGHRRIAHIAGPHTDFATAGSERLDGFRAGIAACALAWRDEYCVTARRWNPEEGTRLAKQLLALQDPPTAIFASADILAVGVVAACREAGLSIPGDISLVGFDDIEAVRYLHPALTTFRQDKAEIGRISAEELLSRIAGKPTTLRVKVPVSLIERESCGLPRRG